MVSDALLPPPVNFIKDFIPKLQADEIFQRLLHELPLAQKQVRVFGVWHNEPRLTAWHGDAGAVYTYAGVTQQPQPWTPALQYLRDRLADFAPASFNSVLANYYRDGRDAMGWHSDDEPELGPAPTIASLSFGACRRFVMAPRHKPDKRRVVFELSHGSLLIMQGDCQKLWRHALPKSARVLQPRLNLTFRHIYARHILAANAAKTP